MPKIVMFVWRLLQLLTKPFWCSLQGVWRWWRFYQWQKSHSKTDPLLNPESRK
jgi:hypothetical protein